MWKTSKKVFFGIFLFSISGWGQSSSQLAFSRNSRTFESQHASLLVKSLAFACLSLEEVPDSLPCNPAMTPKVKKPGLKVEGLLSNGYSNLSKTRKLLTGESNEGLVNELVSEQRVLQVEAQADVMFTSPFLSSRLSPFGYRYFSVLRNDANPDVELFAVEDQELVIQTGISWKDLDLGLQLRKVDWKFIRQRFKLLALSTKAGQQALQPKKQTGYFIEPALNYRLPIEWKPRVSVMVVNLGSLDQTYEEFKHPVEVQGGLGISPPLPYGQLDVLLDYKSLNYEETDEIEKVHLGMLYRFGAMNLALGVDQNGGSIGIFYGLEQINAGILFASTQLPGKEEDYSAQTVYVQVGWQL